MGVNGVVPGILGACVVLLAQVCFADAPTVNVPFARKPPRLEGRLADPVWDSAAVIRNLYKRGNRDQLPEATEFRLLHDGQSLWVGVRCSETEPGYPKAHLRSPTDDLSLDDAVQVILGTADRNDVSREVLNMGGYENALGQPVSSADHYYQFTVNSAGAQARTYNESALERPLFQAKVARFKGCWTVEMRIPLASAGIEGADGLPVFANFFRFRPPDMAAWHLPSFGGYAPMPFGTMKLLAEGEETQRTVQEAAAPHVSAPAQEHAQVKIAWYPLSRRVVADIGAGQGDDGASAALRVSGVGEKRATLDAGSTVRLILDVPKACSLPCKAEASLTDAGGAVLASASRELEQVAEPEWLGTDAGSDFVDAQLPMPWTAPSVHDDTISLLPGDMTFAPCGLFGSVIRAGEELLAGPGEIILSVAGQQATLTPQRLRVVRRGNTAVADATLLIPGGRLELTSRVEFDGFTVCKLRVRGVDPHAIDHLALQFPIRPENARFVHTLLVQEVAELTGFGWEGQAGSLWVGGHERGLAFDFDTPLFLSKRRRSQMQVIEKPGQTLLRINFVDGAGQVTEDGHVFRFFLQPTPTKPVSLRKDGLAQTSLWFEEWSDHEGYPDLKKMPEVKRRAEEAHARGKPFLLYFNSMLAEDSPGFAEFREEFLVPPGHMWYKRAYDPGRDVPCWLCCVRGPYGDLLLDGMRRLAREGGVDGVYMDGTSVPWPCTNPAHAPCAEPISPSWNEDAVTPLMATRSFLQRVRGVFSEGRRPWMFAHTGGAIGISTLSLCDGFYEGEQISRYRPGYRIPLHKFAVGYCGIPWGFRTDTIPASYGARRMMTLAALHDVQVRHECAELEDRIYSDFQDDSSVSYHPYWREQPHVRVVKGDVLFSYYRKRDAAMLVVSNLTWTKQSARLDVSGLFPGEPVSVEDVDAQTPISVSDGCIALEIPSHRFAAVRIEPAANAGAPETPPAVEPPIPADFSIQGYRPSDWDLNPDAKGVTIEPDVDLGRGLRGPKLRSKIYHDYATARFTAHPVGADATYRIALQRNGRWRLDIGRWTLQTDGSRWYLPSDLWREGRVYQPSVKGEETNELVLSIRNGLLDAVYGGQALARDVPVEGLSGNSFLEMKTWGGDWFAFTLLEASSRPTQLFEQGVRHPVL
ncbi:MAG: hypothetical protein HPY44_02840 [Armatimonadetes bacterium]|nr:hypothetical protein [Armatimonadota bacterium]